MVKKKKVKVKTEAPVTEPEPTIAVAGGDVKRKKKKRKVEHQVPEELEVKPTTPGKKLKQKRYLKKQQAKADKADVSPAEEIVVRKVKKGKKKRKIRESGDVASAEHITDHNPGKKLKKKNAECPVSEDSEDDSFFAGDNDAKHGEKKIPDHLHPAKVFVGGLPWAASADSVRSDFAECGEIERFDMPLNDQGKPSGNAYIYYKSEDGVVKALEYDGTDYQGRTIKVKRAVSQKNGEGKSGKGKDGKGKGKDGKGKGKDGKGKDGKGKDDQGKPRNDETTVFVGGLSYDTEYDTIKTDFEECGEVSAVRLVKNAEGMFRGIAFVVFKDEDGVKKALEYDGDSYGGRTIKVSRASDKARGGKDGKGKDDKGKGKDKGGKGKDKGKGKGICYKFQNGKCPFGDECIFAHDASA